MDAKLAVVMGDDWLLAVSSISDSLAALGMRHILEEAALSVACSAVQVENFWGFLGCSRVAS